MTQSIDFDKWGPKKESAVPETPHFQPGCFTVPWAWAEFSWRETKLPFMYGRREKRVLTGQVALSTMTRI